MDLARAEEVYNKLHLIYHRNKNQHGPTAWWRWLSMLRRTLLKILETTQQERQVRLAKYLHAYIIPRCYIAFSTVVADGQFSTLGSVLLAALAQVRDATSLGIDQAEPSNDTTNLIMKESYADDLGVPISRPSEAPVAVPQQRITESPKEPEPRQEASISKLRKTKRKAKKAKSANAIDDIFGSLG